MKGLTSQTASLDPSSPVNAGEASGATSGVCSFDDEATVTYAGPSPAPGRYRPTTPLSILEGKPANGTWRLGIANISTSPGTVRSFSVTITFTTCDTADDAVDNCPVAKPD